MPNNIAAIRSYTTILDRVYQREATSSCLNSPARMARTGRNAKEIMVPKISVSGLGDYKRNVGAVDNEGFSENELLAHCNMI